MLFIYTYNLLIIKVWLNEPLSMIQRLCETFRYADILNKAAKEPNPQLRLAYAACFCVVGYELNIHRTTKFFNPVLGETFEYVDNELNCRYLGEQVSHHPAISAMYAEGDGWHTYGNNNSKPTFNLFENTLEIEQVGKNYLSLFDFGDEISWSKPKSYVRNIMFGEMYVETIGKTICNNHTNGDMIEITYHNVGGPKKPNFGMIDGYLKDLAGNEIMKITGNWSGTFDVVYKENGIEVKKNLWKHDPLPLSKEEWELRYNFSDFTINLNNDDPTLLKTLPRNDSRLRPDQRALEYGDLKLAASEKHRIEEKQRARRKDEAKKKIIYKPLYFTETYDDLSGDLIYLYKKTYWENKKNQNFADAPDIF